MLEQALVWSRRWDAQQEFYIPHREALFSAVIEAVAAAVDRPDPVVVDLGCGPGSLGGRLAERLPRARVVGVDSDPLLLAMAESVYAGPRVRFVSADLAEQDWGALVGAPVDAAVSTTALHWLSEERLRVVYGRVFEALAPGGVLVNGDHLSARSPVLVRAQRRLHPEPVPEGETWEQWWAAVRADPVLGPLAAASREEHGGRVETLEAATHVAALSAAGFAEVDTVWQVGHSRVLAAVRS